MKIRPLVWQALPSGAWWFAIGSLPLAHYSITMMTTGYTVSVSSTVLTITQSLDAAKEAAQQHYEAQILSAFEVYPTDEYVVVRRSQLEELVVLAAPELRESYQGRNLYDESALVHNENIYQQATEDITEKLVNILSAEYDPHN